MPYRFNFTGRRTLRQSDFRIETADLLGALQATLSISGDLVRSFPESPRARLVAEAYRHNEAQRKDLGKLIDFKNGTPVVFDHFADAGHVLFRIKVVDPVSRKLLALGARIRPVGTKAGDGDREKLLPVQFATERDRMGGQIWSLRFEIEHPTLVLDKTRVGGFGYVDDPKFRLLALPQVLRGILVHAFIVCAGRRPKWAPAWRRFVVERLGVRDGPVDDDLAGSSLESYLDDAAEWIDEAVAAFAELNRLGSLGR